ncbi:MAG TPA: hypothetical protein VKV26_12695 [Dehalococcoidia bacterium]|nr:hypothetical protein [Dehalococcoidia bacterium]
MTAAHRDPPFRTLILDDDARQRQLLRTLLEADGRFAIVGEAKLRVGFALDTLRPDLIVVDPLSDGRLDLRYLRQLLSMAPQACVVVCTASWEATAFGDLLLLGVRDVLPKAAIGSSDLGDMLALAGAGEVVVVAVPIVEALRTEFVATRLLGPQLPTPDLNPLEQQLLRGLVGGQSVKAIAAALTAEGRKISARNVQRISERLQQRFGAQTVGQLCAEAVRRGIA